MILKKNKKKEKKKKRQRTHAHLALHCCWQRSCLLLANSAASKHLLIILSAFSLGRNHVRSLLLNPMPSTIPLVTFSKAFSDLGQFSASGMFKSSQTFRISFENLSTIPELRLATHGESSRALGTRNLGVFVSRHTRRSFVLPKLSKFVGDGLPPKDSLVSTKYFPSHWNPCRR